MSQKYFIIRVGYTLERQQIQDAGFQVRSLFFVLSLLDYQRV